MIKRFLLTIALCPLAAWAQLFPIIPPDEGEAESGDDPPAGWTAVEIEATTPTHALNSTVLDYDTGTTTFTSGSNGGWIFGNDDSFGGWAFQVPVSGDFSLTARVVTASTEVVLSKGGIMFRESLTAGSEHCMLAAFYTSSTLVDCRLTTDGTTTTEYFDGIGPVVPDCVRFEYDSDLPSYKLFAKTDATDCSTGTYTELYQNLTFNWTGYVLLATTPSDDQELGKNATTTFDQVVTSTAAVDHTPGDVQFNPTAYSVDEDVTPVTLTVTRLGDGAGACSLNYVVNDGSAIAGTDYTDESGTVSWIDGNTDNKSITVAIIDRDGVAQGHKQFTVVLSTATCPDTLNDATATVTIVDQDAGASWTAMGVCDSVIDGLCGYGLDWTALVDPPSETVYVTNLNTSGTGSLDAAMSSCTSGTVRFVIPTLSGVAVYPQDTNKNFLCDNFVWVGPYAPGEGFHVKGLQTRPQGDRMLFIGWSCFTDADDGQATGRCFDITQGTGTSNGIVLLNVAGAFACDAAFTIWAETDNVSILHSMALYPQNLAGCDFLPQSMLLGRISGDSTNFLIARNVMAHAEHRSPSVGEADAHVVNNVVLNQEVRWTTIGKINDAGITVNVVSNEYLYGVDSNTAINPIQFGSAVVDNIDAPVSICVDGNEAEGITYASQLDLIDDDSGGEPNNANIVSCPAFAYPTGFTVTTITDKRTFALLACSDAGPRPGVNRLPLHQTICDQITAVFDGGDTGTVIDTPADIGGYPTVAVETCDPTIAGDCGTNVPAWPESGTYAQKWAAVNAARCARQRTGAPGC